MSSDDRQAAGGRRETALLRQIVEHLPDIVFRYRLVPEPGYEYISPSVERITGYTPEEFYDDPDFDIKIVHPDDRSVLREMIAQRAEGPIQLRWLHRSGGVVLLDVNVVRVRDRTGTVVGLQGVARDTTASPKAPAQDNDTVIRTLMNTWADPMFLSDVDGRVMECNDAFARIIGGSREDILGKVVQEHWPGIAKRRLDQIQRGIRSRKQVRFDEELGRRYYNIVIHPVTNAGGQVTALAVFGRDITRRKRAEMRMRNSEERYRILYENNPSMYFTVNESGTVLAVNTFGAHQLGYEPGELVGRSVLDVFHPDDRAAVVRQLRGCIERGGQPSEWELRKRRKTGEVMWVKEKARATRDADGSTIVLIVCEDITERRRIEEELQKVKEDLNGRDHAPAQAENGYRLTPRQLAVLHLVVQGKSDKEIGVALGISPLTVNTHVSRVLRKMGASSRTEAGVRALRDGLIQ